MKPTSKERAAACPFCGIRSMNGSPVFAFCELSGEERHVRCVICGACGPWAASRAAALMKWNRRRLSPKPNGKKVGRK